MEGWCKFDAWEEHFNFQKWWMLSEGGVDWVSYVHCQRGEDEVFPWDTLVVVCKTISYEGMAKSLNRNNIRLPY